MLPLDLVQDMRELREFRHGDLRGVADLPRGPMTRAAQEAVDYWATRIDFTIYHDGFPVAFHVHGYSWVHLMNLPCEADSSTHYHAAMMKRYAQNI